MVIPFPHGTRARGGPVPAILGLAGTLLMTVRALTARVRFGRVGRTLTSATQRSPKT